VRVASKPAIDDATRVRALKIYRRHNQKNAKDFIDYVVEKFPFRIHTVRTDRGHEFDKPLMMVDMIPCMLFKEGSF